MQKTITPIDNTLYIEREYNSEIIEDTINNPISLYAATKSSNELIAKSYSYLHDLNTTGLLLFTTDGELANQLMHPSNQIEREYAVRVLGEITKENIRALLNGVELEDGLAKFTDIVDSGGQGFNHWYHVVVMEGRNKEVRRLWESQGVQVTRLIRTRFGSYILPRKKRAGQFWRLDDKEIKSLQESIRS